MAQGAGAYKGRTTAMAGATLVLMTLASAQFLMTLDTSVMNVAIATVAKDVNSKPSISDDRSRAVLFGQDASTVTK